MLERWSRLLDASPHRLARAAVVVAAALLATACSSAWVTVVDSDPAETAWQLTYHNAHDAPVTCDANVHFLSQSSEDALDYGYRDATFTLDPESDRVVEYAEPPVEAPPGSIQGYGYRVLYRNHQGSAEGLFLSCEEVE